MQTLGSSFELPAGCVQIAFSGGRTSGLMLRRIIDACGGCLPDRAKVVFANTGREMPQTLDFVAEVSERWGVPITWLEYRSPWTFAVVDRDTASGRGEPFEALIDDMNDKRADRGRSPMLPTAVHRYCSANLKQRTAKKYLENLGWPRWTAAVGIRADEAQRIPKAPPREKWTLWHPLADAGMTKSHVTEFWASQPFDLNLENIRGKTPEGNCDLCFLKSEATIAAMVRSHPERAEWWRHQEQRTGATFSKDRSMCALVDFIDRQGDWIFDDENDALCQASHGECTGV